MYLKFVPVKAIAAAIALSSAFVPAAQAEDAYIGANLGMAGITSSHRSAEFGLEYRGAPLVWSLYPTVGGFATHRGAAYGYAGFGVEIRLLENVLIRGNTAIGAYSQGNGRDLGHVV